MGALPALDGGPGQLGGGGAGEEGDEQARPPWPCAAPAGPPHRTSSVRRQSRGAMGLSLVKQPTLKPLGPKAGCAQKAAAGGQARSGGAGGGRWTPAGERPSAPLPCPSVASCPQAAALGPTALPLTSLLRGQRHSGRNEHHPRLRVAAQHVSGVLLCNRCLPTVGGRHKDEVAAATRRLHQPLLVGSQLRRGRPLRLHLAPGGRAERQVGRRRARAGREGNRQRAACHRGEPHHRPSCTPHGQHGRAQQPACPLTACSVKEEK